MKSGGNVVSRTLLAPAMVLAVGCAGQQEKVNTVLDLNAVELRSLRVLTNLAALDQLKGSYEVLFQASVKSAQGKAVEECSKENPEAVAEIMKASAALQNLKNQTRIDDNCAHANSDLHLCTAKQLASKFCANEVAEVYAPLNAALGEIVACADMKQGHSIVTHEAPKGGLKIRHKAKTNSGPGGFSRFQTQWPGGRAETHYYWGWKSELDGLYNERGEIVLPETGTILKPGKDIDVAPGSGQFLDVYSEIEGEVGVEPGIAGKDKFVPDAALVKGWSPAKCVRKRDDFNVPEGAVKPNYVSFAPHGTCMAPVISKQPMPLPESNFSLDIGLSEVQRLGIAFLVSDILRKKSGNGEQVLNQCLTEAAAGLSQSDRQVFDADRVRAKGNPLFWDNSAISGKSKSGMGARLSECLKRNLL